MNFIVCFNSFQELRKTTKWIWYAGEIYRPIVGNKNENAFDDKFETNLDRDSNILHQFEVLSDFYAKN